MNKKFFIGLFLAILSGAIFAQDFAFPDLAGYKLITTYPVYGPETLWDFIDGAADTYLSYGFIDLHVAEYKKGKNIIKLEIYHHSDHTLAFGIYSTERSPSFSFMNLGSQGYRAGASINFFKGSCYIKIRTYSKKEKTRQSAELLAHKVNDMITGDTKMPDILAKFPVEGKKLNEETYINESVLGHKFLNTAFKATYEVGNDNFAIYIQENNSPAEAHESVGKYLTSAGMDSVDTETGKYALADGYNGNIFLAWKNNTVVIISGLAKDQTDIADRYTSEILK
jgi:hypothetical protein